MVWLARRRARVSVVQSKADVRRMLRVRQQVLRATPRTAALLATKTSACRYQGIAKGFFLPCPPRASPTANGPASRRI